MPPKKESGKETESRRRQPANTPEDREKQMIAYADELAEQQILAGTASSQVITHYLKLGTSRERLEQERLANENLKLKAQIAHLESQQRAEELIADVLKHMKIYSGAADAHEEE